jgi:hypothetical protein
MDGAGVPDEHVAGLRPELQHVVLVLPQVALRPLPHPHPPTRRSAPRRRRRGALRAGAGRALPRRTPSSRKLATRCDVAAARRDAPPRGRRLGRRRLATANRAGPLAARADGRPARARRAAWDGPPARSAPRAVAEGRTPFPGRRAGGGREGLRRAGELQTACAAAMLARRRVGGSLRRRVQSLPGSLRRRVQSLPEVQEQRPIHRVFLFRAGGVRAPRLRRRGPRPCPRSVS